MVSLGFGKKKSHKKGVFGLCFNCGKELDENYASISYTYDGGEAEYGRLCEDCANILDYKDASWPDVEIEEDGEAKEL